MFDLSKGRKRKENKFRSQSLTQHDSNKIPKSRSQKSTFSGFSLTNIQKESRFKCEMRLITKVGSFLFTITMELKFKGLEIFEVVMQMLIPNMWQEDFVFFFFGVRYSPLVIHQTLGLYQVLISQ